MVRDCRVHQILEGTNEIMRVIISRKILERTKMNEIDIKKINSTIVISLSREKVLNALNLNMVREIYKNIENWNKDEDISGVIIKGLGEKSFCAGGDIVSVYHSKMILK